MATAALISPTAPYPGHHHNHHHHHHHHQNHHHHHQGFSPGFAPHSGSVSGGAGAGASNIAGIISPIEPRRPVDEMDGNVQRQSLPSLPSISEVISGTKPGAYPPTAPTSVPSVTSSTFPSPFAATPRTFAEAAAQHDGHASPQALHPLPPSAYGHPRPEPSSSSFSDSPRAPYSARPDPHGPAGQPPPPPPPPPPPSSSTMSGYTPPHQSPPMDPLNKPGDQGPLGGGSHGAHTQPPSLPPPPPPPSHTPYPHSAALPPGQMPLPRYHPISPQYHGPMPTTPYETVHQQQQHQQQHDQGYPQRRYEAAVGRHLEAWGYQDALMRIASSSRTVYNFAEAFGKIAQEQQSAYPILERLPTEREVSDMINNADWIKKSLENVRELVQYTTVNERSREAKGKGIYEDDQEMVMYDAMKNTFSIPEVKKRRGRAAPPGRCHSCNRIDTPEWRRGPDGARTLCNACGLHYAKLERKRQLDARNGIRSKPSDDSH